MVRRAESSGFSAENPILILIAEDDFSHAEAVRRGLRDASVRIVHVSDGEKAMEYLLHQGEFADLASSPKPDLVLLDLRLPKMDGIEVRQRMSATMGLRQIPTVMLSTSAASRDIDLAYDAGVVSYLVKPMNFDEFKQLIEAFKTFWLKWNVFAP